MLSILLIALVITLPLTAVDPDERRKHIARLRKAIRRADLTELQACQEAEVKQSHWSDACSGERRMAYDWIMALPLEARRWIWFLGVVEEGLPTEVRRSARLALALIGEKKQQARMRIHPQKVRRTA